MNSNKENDRFDRQKRIEGWKQSRLQSARVLVAGAGAVGNEVCKNLAMLGVGEIVVSDMDLIEQTNLNRTTFFHDSDIGKNKAEVLKQRLETQYPQTRVSAHTTRLQEMPEDDMGNFNAYIGSVDNIEARLYINNLAHFHKKPYIDCGTDGFMGKVQVIIPPFTPCIECHVTPEFYKNIGMRFSCTSDVVTPPESDFHVPSVSTITSIISGIAAHEYLKVLFGFDTFIKTGRWSRGIGKPIEDILYINPVLNNYFKNKTEKDLLCHACGKNGILLQNHNWCETTLKTDTTLKMFVDKFNVDFNGTPYLFHGIKTLPDRDFIFNGTQEITAALNMHGHNASVELLYNNILKNGGDTPYDELINKDDKLKNKILELKIYSQGNKLLEDYNLHERQIVTTMTQEKGTQETSNILLTGE